MEMIRERHDCSIVLLSYVIHIMINDLQTMCSLIQTTLAWLPYNTRHCVFLQVERNKRAPDSQGSLSVNPATVSKGDQDSEPTKNGAAAAKPGDDDSEEDDEDQ